MTTLAVLQPGYLPWLGFFDQLRRSDVFVYYDDVQFDKQGWRNRNRIKTSQGVRWLTVPVSHKGGLAQKILDVEIDHATPWAKKHMASLYQSYAQAAYSGNYLPSLERVLGGRWKYLVDLDMAVVELMRGWLGVDTPIYRSSQLGIGGARNQRLLNLCKHFGATVYLSGNAAKSYLDVELFADQGITVHWQDYAHPTYRQLHGEFVPYLSALDMLLNMGQASGDALRGAA